MSAQETPENLSPKLTESRRLSLIRRQRQLLHELDHIAQELIKYSLEVTDEEVVPVVENFEAQKTRLHLETMTDGMENVLGVYDPKTLTITDVAPETDSVTIKALNYMIERGHYRTDVDLKVHEEPLALRLHIGDEHHGKSILDGALLISSLSQAANGAKWLAHIKDGEVVVNDIVDEDLDRLTRKIRELIVESEFDQADLEDYYLFVGNGEKFTEYLNAESKVVNFPETETPAPTLLEVSKAASNNYLAKIGPQGRIRHHYSMVELKKMAADRGHDVKSVMTEINDMAIDRAEADDFVYVHFKD